ncbi:MAG: ATP-binding cassette domain-containing protein, partial [Betaproteobacteria bacterium]
MLKLSGVNVHYGKLHILRGVSLEVGSGESVALLGRNGVGKTTTLRAIMGLARRSAGSVEFNGVDLARVKPYEVPRLGIGYVPQ